MSTDETSMQGIAETARAGVAELTTRLREAFGHELAGLTVFGSAVTNDFGSNSRVRSVAVVTRIDVAALNRLAADGASLGRHRVEAPLIMTPQYVRDSLDAFPIELMEIHQVHHTLLGDDHFADLDFRKEDVRLQCEREFKRMMIRLRQGLLASQGKAGSWGALLTDLNGHAVRVLRGVIWLHKDRRPMTPAAVWSHAARVLGLELAALARRETNAGPADVDEISRVYETLEKLAERINAM